MAGFQNLASFLLGLGGRATPGKLRCTGRISLAAAGPLVVSINLTQIQNTVASFIDAALSMYVDNGGQANELVFIFSSGQQIVVPPNTQGYYNILQPNPINLTVNVTGASAAYAMLINAFLPSAQWAADAL